MKKQMNLILSSMIALATLTACGQSQMPLTQNIRTNMPAQNILTPNRVGTFSTSKSGANAVKSGDKELKVPSTKGQPKNAAPLPKTSPQTTPSNSRARRGMDSEITTMARLGLRAMDRTRTWEDGYNVGNQTMRTLSSQGSYIAKLATAASRPAMKYESAYKVLAHAMRFISEERHISINSTVNLIRKMMDSAKTWEDGARIGYATIDHISRTAEPGMRRILQNAERTARSANYWEDAYRILMDTYTEIARSHN